MNILIKRGSAIVARKRESHSASDIEFQLVHAVPNGYTLWNINMIKGYLPFCMLKPPAEQPFDGATEVNTSTLKAVRIDGAEYVLGAACAGQDTAEKMREYIEQHKTAKLGSYEQSKVGFMRKALSAIEKVNWI